MIGNDVQLQKDLLKKQNKMTNEEIKNAMDPLGLLNEPTSEEMQAWEASEFLSDNPYVLIGWLVNYRKRKIEEELNNIIKKEKI